MTARVYDLATLVWQRMRKDYQDALEAAYLEAEAATNGYMVNAAGRAKDLRGWDLLTGPESRAYRYASPELIEHWMARPRLTATAFEAQWLSARGGLQAFVGELAADE